MKNWEVCGIICSEYYHINNNLSRCFAKIDQMLEWGVVQVEDVLIPKGRAEEALLLESGQVRTANGEMSMQAWLKSVFGWQSVDTYNFAVLKRTGQTLSDIRAEYMKQETEIVAAEDLSE